jgi:hypothetical protein
LTAWRLTLIAAGLFTFGFVLLLVVFRLPLRIALRLSWLAGRLAGLTAGWRRLPARPLTAAGLRHGRRSAHQRQGDDHRHSSLHHLPFLMCAFGHFTPAAVTHTMRFCSDANVDVQFAAAR